MAIADSITIAVVAAIAIYFASLLFVSGIEWVGFRMRLTQGATGALLAAIGTALPETMITFIAAAFGGAGGKDIGVGTALGGPLVLSTFGYGAFGVALIALRHRQAQETRPPLDRQRLGRDQIWFVILFATELGLGNVAFKAKTLSAFAFLAAYGVYVWRAARDEKGASVDLPPPLLLRPAKERPPIWLAILQVSMALLIVTIASHFFVARLEALGMAAGLSPQMTGLLLSPLATEMPEVINTVIWVRRGKPGMALANISGAMVVQTAAPAALGVGLTPWCFDLASNVAALLTIAATIVTFLIFRRGRNPTTRSTPPNTR